MILEWHLRALQSSRVLRSRSSSKLKMPVDKAQSIPEGNVQARVAPLTPQTELRHSTRQTKAPKRYSPALHYLLLTDGGEPECNEEALHVEAKAEWEVVMDDEIASIMGNQT